MKKFLYILLLILTMGMGLTGCKKEEAPAEVEEDDGTLVSGGFGTRLKTIINSEGYELAPLSEEEFIAQYEGDWHGMITFANGQGRFYKALEKTAGEVAARFSFDADGNCSPYLAMPLSKNYNDKGFRDIYASHEDTTGGLFIGGDFLLGSFAVVMNPPDETGLITCSFLLQDTIDPEYVDVTMHLRRVNTPWYPYDDVQVPPATFNHALNKTVEEQAEFFGLDVSLVPPASHITNWELPYDENLRITKVYAQQIEDELAGVLPKETEGEEPASEVTVEDSTQE